MADLTTNQKGAIAETAIVHAAVKAGIRVLKPLADERYDLVFDLGGRFIRVQCKWAARRGDILVVRCRSCRRGPEGLRHRGYSPDEIDAFAAYCAVGNRSYYLPMEWVGERAAVQLRVEPARNNQRLRINAAADFDFDRLEWSKL